MLLLDSSPSLPNFLFPSPLPFLTFSLPFHLTPSPLEGASY